MKPRQILNKLILKQLKAAAPASLSMDFIKKAIQPFGCKFADHDFEYVLKELLTNGLIVEFVDDLSCKAKIYSLV
ncbi:MAG: hypothetical protein LBI37_02785 [Puniceicoccales bacterium]|jgi:hypothetical protein|nr:hypothetical protein [Puniceicoccales bacterium]